MINSLNSPTAWLALTNKVVVVTGAAHGIGAAIAAEAAAVGAHVALLDLDIASAKVQADNINRAGGSAHAFACNSADQASVLAAADAVEARWGRVDALTNNAGILKAGELSSIELADWNQVLNINLTGYLLVARRFANTMRAQGQGSIVHIASISGMFPQTNSGAYSAAKAGVLLMSKQMAVEWGKDGIRSNAICPGMIRTRLSAEFYKQPGFEAKRAEVTASKRIGEPQDIANVAVFLMSPRSAYVNAAELLVDGGMSAMLMDRVPRPGFNTEGQA